MRNAHGERLRREAEPIGIGILGYGRFAQRRARPTIEAYPGARLVAVQVRRMPDSEVIPKRATVFLTSEDLVRSIDVEAVYVTSANAIHESDVISALRAGKPVLCEKPMATTPDACERMIREAVGLGVYLGVAHMTRMSRALRRVRSLVRGGVIGIPRLASAVFPYQISETGRSWASDPDVAGGGPMLDAGIHAVDALRFILDDEVERVAALSKTPRRRRVEVAAGAAIEFSHGTVGLLAASAEAFFSPSLEIVGSKGRVRAPSFAQTWGSVELEVETRGGVRRLTESVADTYMRQLAGFCRSVRAKSRSVSSAFNGLENVRVISAIYSGQSRLHA